MGLGSCFPCKVRGACCVKCFTSHSGLGKEHGGAEPASWSRGALPGDYTFLFMACLGFFKRQRISQGMLKLV